nr:MAG TPA: hypothetical protein [Caudoviricetes sp.]
MWIMLNNAFISVVDKAPNPEQLVVRARVEGHIEAVFPQAEVIRDASGDYLFRAFIDRRVVAAAMQRAVMDIDYPNFKNSIKDDRYHDACSSVWGVMSRLQPVRPYSGRPSRNYDLFGAGGAGKTSTRAKKAR